MEQINNAYNFTPGEIANAACYYDFRYNEEDYLEKLEYREERKVKEGRKAFSTGKKLHKLLGSLLTFNKLEELYYECATCYLKNATIENGNFTLEYYTDEYFLERDKERNKNNN